MARPPGARPSSQPLVLHWITRARWCQVPGINERPALAHEFRPQVESPDDIAASILTDPVKVTISDHGSRRADWALATIAGCHVTVSRSARWPPATGGGISPDLPAPPCALSREPCGEVGRQCHTSGRDRSRGSPEAGTSPLAPSPARDSHGRHEEYVKFFTIYPPAGPGATRTRKENVQFFTIAYGPGAPGHPCPVPVPWWQDAAASRRAGGDPPWSCLLVTLCQ